MHLVGYTPDPHLPSRLRAALDSALHCVADRTTFERSAARADLLIVCVERLDEPGSLELVRTVRARNRGRPLLLVTSGERDNTEHLARIEVDRVVWVEELEQRLRACVEELGRITLRERLATAVAAADGLSMPLRTAISAALRQDFPLRRVDELIRLTGVSPRTFREHWRRHVHRLTGSTLRQLLRLLLLLRLLELRPESDSWSKAAQALGVELSYLEGIANRELGRPLGALDEYAAIKVSDVILQRLGIGPP